MDKAAKQTRTNRTITIDFQHEATYVQLLGDGKAFLECMLAFILSLSHGNDSRENGPLRRNSGFS